MTTILKLLDAVFGMVDQILTYLTQQRLIKAGEDRVLLETREAVQKTTKEADEIDHQVSTGTVPVSDLERVQRFERPRRQGT